MPSNVDERKWILFFSQVTPGRLDTKTANVTAQLGNGGGDSTRKASRTNARKFSIIWPVAFG
eukprot:CAMPEP_0197458210 /NCGR_PEP_ID=MMETSP1175-20131217/48062_1 /TAXON_ID=1003142 /ORGANISM="Triceratium dubium, Strain CCMP147" /LENGTH=61 /DNA_ID=CAMNT_0042992785 /DNA_START=72 /DNA_END=254 /DNA_ORIENTATION=-